MLLWVRYYRTLTSIITVNADDTQLYVSLSPDDCSPADVMCQCLEEINTWMRENFLQLNEDKTENSLFGSKEKRVSIGKYLGRLGPLQSLTKFVTLEC